MSPPNSTNALLSGQPAETLRDFLGRRKRELTAQVAALRGQIAPMERELQEIEVAIEALPPGGVAPPLSTLAMLGILNQPDAKVVSSGVAPPTFGLGLLGQDMRARFQSMTIKELAVQALLDGFPNGASTAQLREFIHNAYGRTIESSSLRPQLHRLKSDGKLQGITLGSGDVWNLEPKARMLYSRYNHPSSRTAMPELQRDEPPSSE